MQLVYSFLLKDSNSIRVVASNLEEAWDRFKEAYKDACASGYVGKIGLLFYRTADMPVRQGHTQILNLEILRDLEEFKMEIRMFKRLQGV